MQRVFDGHNDVLLRLWRQGDLTGRRFLDGDGEGHVDLPRARAGGLAGGIFAVYVPGDARTVGVGDADDGGVVDFPPLGPVDSSDARRITLEMAGILICMARERPDALRICRSAAEIGEAEAAGAIAAILHLEGAEAIGPECGELEVLYAAGLRSLGPVWSRPNVFGFGIPFRFPGDPDEGPGLTAAGRELVRACNRLGIVFDLSHLNAAGFRDVARLSDKPLVATHSNAHAIAPASRNLTDAQLDAIAESGGVVGLNYAVGFLRDDGRRVADTALTVLVRHLDHLLGRLGENGVALGSDFDGALIPREIGDAAGLPALVGAMRQAGYGEALIEKICWRNWVGVLARTIG
jgi:membrane dipeptidase